MIQEKYKKKIEPQVQTPPPDALDQTTSFRLPDDVLTEQVKRVGVCAAVAGGLWTYGLVMDAMITPLSLQTPILPQSIVIDLASIGLAVVMFAYVRFARHSPQTKINAGLIFFVLNAVAIALLNTWGRQVIATSVERVSWNSIAILVASMILPATPRKILAASLVAASTDPLCIWLAHLRGEPVPSVLTTLVLFMPNYACAVVSTLPSNVLQHLGRRLSRARDMGSYHLVEMLGRGGMGEVWRGNHRMLARSAAIKIVRPELLGAGSDAEAMNMLRRFEREAQATAALSSPHTIRVFDFGVTAERSFYYVMELLDGRDLDSLVKEFGPVPADRTLHLLQQVCHSLADAHARGLVHRDVTPANIYVCRMGLDYDFVKVLDFGLVKFSDRESMQRTLMTGAHMTTGTPAYMAPEIILDEGAVDQRADIYALGCVAYYMLTGQLVFEADTAMKMFLQHLQATPIPPSQRTEMPIPREIDELVLACLDKDPSRRPQNASELLEMIGGCRASGSWDNNRARAWWERHLVDLTGPLQALETPFETVERTLVAG